MSSRVYKDQRRGRRPQKGNRERGRQARVDSREPSHSGPPDTAATGVMADHSAPRRNRGMSDTTRRMFLRTTAEITVIVRTRNAEPYLDELLASIKDQENPYGVEILAADVGSVDRTPLILRSHGLRTLDGSADSNLTSKALTAAEGDVCVLISQETLPLRTSWLSQLVAPLFEDRQLGMTYGRLIADASISPYERGLIAARKYLSGRERINFSGARAPGSTFVPQTNLALRRTAFSRKEEGGSSPLALGARPDARRVYVPTAEAVVRQSGPTLSGPILNWEGLPASAGPAWAVHAFRMWDELYDLSDRGNLPQGERGEAYAIAIGLHTARMLKETGWGRGFPAHRAWKRLKSKVFGRSGR